MLNINEEITAIQNRIDHLDEWDFDIKMSDRISETGWEVLRKNEREKIELRERLARLVAFA